MTTCRLTVLLLTVVFLSSISRGAEEAPPGKSGLPVGQKAPAFSLKDQVGRDISLDSLLEKGPVALVFYRSADW